MIAVKVRITSEEREEVVIRKRNVWGGASGVLEVFYCLTLVVLMWKVKVKLLNHVWLFVTPWTVAHQAPPAVEFSRQVLEWVAISFSRGSSWPRDRTRVSHIAGRRFTVRATRAEAQVKWYYHLNNGRKYSTNQNIGQSKYRDIDSWSTSLQKVNVIKKKKWRDCSRWKRQ